MDRTRLPGRRRSTVVPAAVSAAFPGDRPRHLRRLEECRREVLELRAQIDRGDSGGPFILTDEPVRWRRLRRGARPTRTSATRCRRGRGRLRASRPGSVSTAAVDTRRTACGPGAKGLASTSGRGRVSASSHVTSPTQESPMPETPAPHPIPPKRHSAALTDGPDRAGARAMLKAIGFTDEDLAKPLVGVATTWIETMPCNYNQRRLAESRQGGHPGGRRDADGVQHDLGQRRRDDGHRGDEGVARSAARSSPTRSSSSSAATCFDGVVCLVGCDKTMPGAAMALGRPRRPGARALQRHDLPRHRTRARATSTVVTRLRGDRRVPGGQDHASTSCTRSRTSPARAPARAAASSRPTR